MFSLIPWKKKQERSNGLAVGDSFENQLVKIRDDFNALTERMFGNWSRNWPVSSPELLGSAWNLGLDVDETEKHFVVRAEAPGFEADEFDIQVRGNQLVIRAEQNKETKSKNGSSFSSRSFHRSMNLPQGAEIDSIEANYKNGILELQLPKGEDFQSKRITVQTK